MPWVAIVVGTVLALAALTVDVPASRWLTGPDVRPGIAKVIDTCKGLAPLAVIVAILASFPNWRLLLVGFLIPVLGHLPILHGLKFLIGRMRPTAEAGAFAFRPLSFEKYADAFPSGHTMTAAVLALLLGIYFPRARWVFYAWMLVMGLERIVIGMHYLSDVLAAYVLAGVIVFGCVRLLGREFYCKDLLPRADARR